MPTKKSLLATLKGKKIIISTSNQNSAIDILPEDPGDGRSNHASRYYTHTITTVGDELFEAKNTKGEKEYFSIAHIRHIVL
jgi:hypothetical protein